MSSQDVRSIQCTQCGAPLELFGGHKVRGLTCAYCGSIMDAHKDFQVIKRYRDKADRPDTPFKPGMRGRLKEVDFTLIGLVQYTAEEGDRWVDFQLFSPTRGYAWLSLENGKYSFSRRTRELPDPIEASCLRENQIVKFGDLKLRVEEECYRAKISYVEGELTWIAKRGDTRELVDASAPPYSLTYEKTGQEYEYFLGESLDAAEVHKAFGIAAPEKSRTPGEPYPLQNFFDIYGRIAKLYLILAVAGLFISLFAEGLTSLFFGLLTALIIGISICVFIFKLFVVQVFGKR
ncbi:MAG: DUF4178 domain-containing protein [Gammaproteobacteria bacterium]|nr:DUF4178 domain-containing protein [Gammaproteobacteria bacterium]